MKGAITQPAAVQPLLLLLFLLSMELNAKARKSTTSTTGNKKGAAPNNTSMPMASITNATHIGFLLQPYSASAGRNVVRPARFSDPDTATVDFAGESMSRFNDLAGRLKMSQGCPGLPIRGAKP